MAKIIIAAAILVLAPYAGIAQSGPATMAPASNPLSAPALVIGSGDLVEIGMFDAPELSGHFRVNQNGDVEMPLVDSIHVAGLTAEQASELIKNKYIQSEILVPGGPRPSVFISEYANQGITVTGEVKSPGIYPAFGVRMLNDVVTAAGGVTPGAASTAVITHRNDPQHPITVDYQPESKDGMTQGMQVFPGDTVMVPRAGIIYVLGNVNKSGGFVLDGHDPLTAEKAMALAGGEGHAAALKRTQLVRTIQDGRKVMITVPLDRILKGKAADVSLRDGDILYIPTSNGKLATMQAITSAVGIGSAVTIYKIGFR